MERILLMAKPAMPRRCRGREESPGSRCTPDSRFTAGVGQGHAVYASLAPLTASQAAKKGRSWVLVVLNGTREADGLLPIQGL